MPKIKNPTLRKIRSRGLKAIRYRRQTKTTLEVRHGWIESDDGKELRVRLIGEDGVRRIRGRERAFVQELP